MDENQRCAKQQSCAALLRQLLQTRVKSRKSSAKIDCAAQCAGLTFFSIEPVSFRMRRIVSAREYNSVGRSL
jgi:hypothetical protein